jgi:hypothetical protein
MPQFFRGNAHRAFRFFGGVAHAALLDQSLRIRQAAIRFRNSKQSRILFAISAQLTLKPPFQKSARWKFGLIAVAATAIGPDSPLARLQTGARVWRMTATHGSTARPSR